MYGAGTFEVTTSLYGPPAALYRDKPQLRTPKWHDQFNLAPLFNNPYGSDITLRHKQSERQWLLHSHVLHALTQSIPTQASLDALADSTVDAQHVENMFALIYGATSLIVAVTDSPLKDLIIILHLMDGLMMSYDDYVFLSVALNTFTQASSETVIVQVMALLEQLMSILDTHIEYARPLNVIVAHLMLIIEHTTHETSDGQKVKAFIQAHGSRVDWIDRFVNATRDVTRDGTGVMWIIGLDLSQQHKIRPFIPRFSTAVKLYGNFALASNNIDGMYSNMLEQAVVTESLKQMPVTLLPSPDFCIRVAGSRSIFMVHSWFLYCVWPYFKTAIEYDTHHTNADTKEMELQDVTVEQVSFALRGLYNADKSKLYYTEDEGYLIKSIRGDRSAEDEPFQLANRYGIPRWAIE